MDKEIIIKGMNYETAKRYVKVIDTIEELADEIHGLADILSLLSELSNYEIKINPRSIACFGKIITYNILRIIDLLDNNFVSIAEVKLALEAKQNKL